MAETCLVDGVAVAQIPADDRGLAYGDGVFRTLRVRGGVPEAWPDHMIRLAHDCAALDLECPGQDTLAAEARTLFPAGGDGVLKILVTRGSGGRGYTPPDSGSRRIVSAHALPAHASDVPPALTLERAAITLGTQPVLAGVKHLNRLEQVLARAECARLGHADAFMCGDDERIVATTMRNLLFRDERGDWQTPLLDRAGVMGVTRTRVMRALAAAGTPVVERDIPLVDVTRMSAVVACNSVGGIAAVASLHGWRMPDSASAAADCRRLLEAG